MDTDKNAPQDDYDNNKSKFTNYQRVSDRVQQWNR